MVKSTKIFFTNGLHTPAIMLSDESGRLWIPRNSLSKCLTKRWVYSFFNNKS